MNIFLSGATGFSGSYLAQHLLKAGHNVIGNARQTAHAINATFDNLSNSLGMLAGDLNTLQALPDNTDIVIHTAATSPNQKTCVRDFIYDNALATARLIDLASKLGVKKFIFFSSLSLYGEIQNPVVDENTPILNPGAYGTSKLFGELAIKEYAHKIPSIALRLPAVIGPGAARHWLANLIQKALTNQKITFFNPNALFNNAVHISDLCHFIDKVLYQPLSGFHPLTIASDGYLSIQTIVNTIIERFNSSSEVVVEQKNCHSFTISNRNIITCFNHQPSHFKEVLERYLLEVLAHNASQLKQDSCVAAL